MVAGNVCVQSQLTETTIPLCFAGLYPRRSAHHRWRQGCRPRPTEWLEIGEELTAAVRTGDVFAAQRAIERHFPGRASCHSARCCLASREAVLEAVLGDAIHGAPNSNFGDAYDQHAPLIRWLVAHDLPVPDVLHTIAETTLIRRVLANMRSDGASFQLLRHQLAEAAEVKVSLDTREIALAASDSLRRPDREAGRPRAAQLARRARRPKRSTTVARAPPRSRRG